MILQGCCGLLDWPIGDVTPAVLESFQNTFLESGKAGDPLGKFLSNDQEILPSSWGFQSCSASGPD